MENTGKTTKQHRRSGNRRGILSLVSNWQLGSQLTFLVALGMFIMVLAVSVGTSIIINQSLTNNFIQNGKNIASVLAEQSALPVLLGSPEGARQAIGAVLSFPSVAQVAIYEANGTVLAESGNTHAWSNTALKKVGPQGKAVLEHDGDQFWQFLSPVYSDSAEPELEDLEAQRKQIQEIGIVRVLIAKDQLYSARDNILAGNIIVLLTVAVLLVLALNGLSGALTEPLEVFVNTMSSGAHGEKNNLRVDLSGSQETKQLSNAFNQMMQVLEDRETELATARDQALAAAKLKSEFAANVSHEIRTPLNGMLGTLNLLHDTGLDSEQKELLAVAESSSEALMILINDILDFSRLSLDQSTLVNTEFDLYQLLEELMFLHAQSVDAKALDVLMHYDPGLPYVVETDPNKLRQLLNNLINNAVKFTDLGSVMITANKETDAEGKLWVRLAVRDTGIGISEEDLRTIFLPYSQSDGSMSRKYSGTGLGLAISDKLAELLHGDIGVYSDLGVGSEFYARIPFSYRVPTSNSSSPDFPWFAKPIYIYGDTEDIRDACENMCAINHLKPNVYDSMEQLESDLSKQSEVGDTPLVIFYLSVGSEQLTRWQAVKKIIATLALNAIVVCRKNINTEYDSGNVIFVRPPLRAGQFRSALAKLFEVRQPENKMGASVFSDVELAGYTALLVEDNIVNQRVAKSILRKLGCEVVVAENGIEALEQINRHGFDLIYMDCQMPKMNGYDAARAIRQMDGDSARLPIIAMTANVGQQDRAHCFDAGMNDFLGKPVKMEDLVAVTLKWLAIAPKAQSLLESNTSADSDRKLV